MSGDSERFATAAQTVSSRYIYNEEQTLTVNNISPAVGDENNAFVTFLIRVLCGL